MNKRMNRRIFLRGLGGAVVAAPFLSSVCGARRRRGRRPAKPKQLIVMFTPLRLRHDQLFPAKSHGALAASDLMATNLAPLAPFAEQAPDPARHPRDERVDREQQIGHGQGAGRGTTPT